MICYLKKYDQHFYNILAAHLYRQKLLKATPSKFILENISVNPNWYLNTIVINSSNL